MNCLTPICVKDKSYSSEIRSDNGHLSATGFAEKGSTWYHFVPCGTCPVCLSRKREEWSFRLMKEQAGSSYSYFLTLTYDDQNIPIRIVENKPYFVFDKKHVQDYLKRVRYYISELNKDVKCSYYAVSEYGTKGLRPHYHMQFFVKNDDSFRYRKSIETILEENWKFGYFQRKVTSPANIHYVTKYCLKGLEELDSKCIDKPFILVSKRPYIGQSAAQFIEKQSVRNMVFNNGYKQVTPRIYHKKMFIEKFKPQIDSSWQLPPKLLKQFEESYLKLNPSGSISDDQFVLFVNRRKKQFIEDCRRRQLTRQEKL